jgi:hypothetical protein
MRRRVLVEHTDPLQGVLTARALHDAGYAVATCPGPTVAEPCPLLRGRDCDLARRAHAIVSNLGDHPDGRCVAAGLRVRHPRVPFVRNVEPDDASAAVHAALGR